MIDWLNGNDQDSEAPPRPSMPDLSNSRHAFHHTVDSGLLSLLDLGVDPDAVTIRKTGPGWVRKRIVSQEPAPEREIGFQDGVVLEVGDDGLFHRLPVGLRDRGTNLEAGIDSLLSVIDDPSEKVNCYVRQGALYFDLRPDNLAGCARWIRLFGLIPEGWPAELWYPLARFLPSVHRLAGRESGIRLGCRVLLGLDIVRMEWGSQQTLLTNDALTRIGNESTRLGVDFVIGSTIEDEAVLNITFGPLTLAQYRRHQKDDMKRRREMVFDLVVPCHIARSVGWVVGQPEYMPRLQADEDNAVLAINMHLGRRMCGPAADEKNY